MKTKIILLGVVVLFLLVLLLIFFLNLPKETMQIIELPARQLNATGIF